MDDLTLECTPEAVYVVTASDITTVACCCIAEGWCLDTSVAATADNMLLFHVLPGCDTLW
jgi:hypothetical protein